MDPWLSRRLHVATRAQRHTADADARAWISQPLTRERYREFLIRVYGIEAPLESAFAMMSGIGAWGDGERRKIALLADDLCALDVTADCLLALPRCPIAPFRDACEALGWIYMLDANLTNRQIVARWIAPHALPGAYLASPDRPASELVDLVESPRDATAIVDAALAAYNCQHDWLQPDAALRRHTNVAFRR